VGDVRRFKRLGGHVAIDFVNTLGGRPEDPDDEYLHSYDDLVTWTEQVDLLGPAAANHLRAIADQDPTASMALAQSLQLRDSLDRILRSRTEPATRHANDDAATIQACYLPAIAHAALQLSADGLEWAWPDDTDDLQRPLWPLAVAAVDLIQTAPLDLLKRCQHCRWLFLDNSRQHNRRWCSMDGCGAIVKMRRYRTRAKA
jgi:predicted RNA-binding Zn ribbon-like protein